MFPKLTASCFWMDQNPHVRCKTTKFVKGFPSGRKVYIPDVIFSAISSKKGKWHCTPSAPPPRPLQAVPPTHIAGWWTRGTLIWGWRDGGRGRGKNSPGPSEPHCLSLLGLSQQPKAVFFARSGWPPPGTPLGTACVRTPPRCSKSNQKWQVGPHRLWHVPLPGGSGGREAAGGPGPPRRLSNLVLQGTGGLQGGNLEGARTGSTEWTLER